MVLSPRLRIPYPVGLTQVSRATMISWLDAIEANAATVEEHGRPFEVTASAWDGPGTRIRVTLGPGRARVGDQVIDKTDPTIVDINAPAVGTTYSIYLADDGTFVVATGTGDVDGQARIHQVVTGSPASVFTVADVRSELPGAPSSGVVLSNSRYIQARVLAGTKRQVIGRNASDELVVGDAAVVAATRFVKAIGGYYAFEVNGTTKVRIDGTGLGIGMTPANPLDVTGAARISGAVTLQSTLAVTGAVTSGTINGQTISSAAAFTGSLGVGTAPSFKTHVADTQTTNPLLVVEAAAANATATQVQLRKQRGTLGVIDATSAVVSGDGLGSLAFYAANSSAYRLAAEIRVEADGSPGPAVVPGRILFFTSSAISVAERVRIDSTGLGIGMTPANPLDVNGAARISGALNVTATGSVFSAGANSSTDVTIGGAGTGGIATAYLYLKAPSTNVNANGNASVRYWRAGTEKWAAGIDDTAALGAKSSANDFMFWNGSTYAAALSTGGKLTLASKLLSQSTTHDAGSPDIQLNNQTDLGMFAPTTSTIGFSTAGVERVRIDSSGNLLQQTAGTQIRGQNGSASSPIYTFAGANTTGMYHEGSNVLAWCNAGTKYLSLDASGNLIQVGGYHSIGSSPATTGTIRLAAGSTIVTRSASQDLTIAYGGVGSDHTVYLGLGSGSAGVGSTYLESSGNLYFRTNAVGTVAGYFATDRGFVVGTGATASQGAGTLAVATNVYKGTTAYTNPDFVFELWATGSVEKYANEAWSHYRRLQGERLWTLREIEEYVRIHWRFPIVDDSQPNGSFTDGRNLGRDDIALALTEQAYTHLFDHDHRLDAMRQEIADLRAELAAVRSQAA